MDEAQVSTETVKAKSENNKPPTLAERIAKRHPDWPPIKMKIYFSAHGSTQDMAGMKDHLADSDIYLYEGTHNDEFRNMLQDVADTDPSQFPSNHIDEIVDEVSDKYPNIRATAQETIIRSLYGSKKVVGNIDRRPDDPVNDVTMKNVLREISNIIYEGPSGGFEQTLQKYRERLSEYAHLQTAREMMMVERLESELASLIEAHPELKEKENINILYTLGSAHTPLYHELKKESLDIERAFPHTPYIFGFKYEADRNVAFGLELTDDLLAKVYLEDIFDQALNRSALLFIWPSYEEKEEYLRLTTSAFTTDDIRKVYEQSAIGSVITPDKINDLLVAKGLDPLPKSPDQLHDILERKKRAEETKIAEVKADFQQRRQTESPK